MYTAENPYNHEQEQAYNNVPKNEKEKGYKQDDFVILAPDDPSGRTFESRFKKLGLGLPYEAVDIRPRVIGNEKSDNYGVYADLIDAIQEQNKQGHTQILIACNTLQFWATELAEYPEFQESFPGTKLITTFEVAKEMYPEREKRPMWLGTTVTSNTLSKEEFDTPTNSGEDDIQDLVQEIIWRTKASSPEPADYSGALERYEDITNPQLMTNKTKQLVEELKKRDINSVFLGCTELPIAFNTLESEDLEDFEAVDLADLMAKKTLGMLEEKSTH